MAVVAERRRTSRLRRRLSSLSSGLFWRTFFLLAFLITASLATWVTSFRNVERAPRASQIAAQVVSIVTITRTALTHSAPDLRRELLFDLASNEGIRIYTREENDVVKLPPENVLLPEIEQLVRASLGDETRFAGSVNDLPGFWVSFKIADEDDYWLMLDRERLDRRSGVQWFGWGAVTLVLSLLGAVFITGLINLPLRRLTAATRAMASGNPPAPLPETGPMEIREANRSFNQMVRDLHRVESDRAVILASISHDLRTPIARMLLEVEMANLSGEARSGMQSDLAQMDAIIGQFLDYARPTDSSSFSVVDLSDLLAAIVQEGRRWPDVRITAEIAEGALIRGNQVDLRRVFANLIENARRYGKTVQTAADRDGDDEKSAMPEQEGAVAPEADMALTEIDIRCRVDGNTVTVEFADHGSGVPNDEMEQLLRPFTRMDAARSQANGAGLGLAIVERIVKRHGAALRMSNRAGGGLAFEIRLPRVHESG